MIYFNNSYTNNVDMYYPSTEILGKVFYFESHKFISNFMPKNIKMWKFPFDKFDNFSAMYTKKNRLICNKISVNLITISTKNNKRKPP